MTEGGSSRLYLLACRAPGCSAWSEIETSLIALQVVDNIDNPTGLADDKSVPAQITDLTPRSVDRPHLSVRHSSQNQVGTLTHSSPCLRRKMTSSGLQAKAAQLIAARDAQVTPDYRFSPSSPFPLDVSDLYRSSGFLSARQIDIVSHDATSLSEAIAKRTYTAVEVTEAFCRSAALAQETTNCLAWFAPKEALEAAKGLDEAMQKTGRPVGPLHGVPISVKGGCSV
jgi:hypothetical protein